MNRIFDYICHDNKGRGLSCTSENRALCIKMSLIPKKNECIFVVKPLEL